MFSLGGWWGMNWREGYSSKLRWGTSEAQKPALRDCASSLMAEMKHIQQCGCLDCSEKRQHWI